MKLIKVVYPDHYSFHEVWIWCKKNATGKFYNGRAWDQWKPGGENRLVEFENEEDAVLFRLRWS